MFTVTSDVFLFSILYKAFTSAFLEAFISFGGATPPRSSQTVYHAARTFSPDNSFYHANSSVLQAKQIISSQSTSFIILLSKLLHLGLCLDFFTVLPYPICRVFALQCSPVVVVDIEESTYLQSCLSKPCPLMGILYHALIS